MRYGLTLVTPPAAEPITLAEAKAHLRVDLANEDALITSLIVAARQLFEGDTGRALVTQTWELSLDYWPAPQCIRVPLPPLQSVTSITYFPATGAPVVLAPADYFVDTASYVGRIVAPFGTVWPAFTPRPANAVVVRFVAGAADAAAVEQTDKQALLLLIGHWYANREASVPASIGNKEISLAYEALVWRGRAGVV